MCVGGQAISVMQGFACQVGCVSVESTADWRR